MVNNSYSHNNKGCYQPVQSSLGLWHINTHTPLCRILSNSRTDFFSTNWVTEPHLFSSEFHILIWFRTRNRSPPKVRLSCRWSPPQELPTAWLEKPRPWTQTAQRLAWGWANLANWFVSLLLSTETCSRQMGWLFLIQRSLGNHLSHFHSKTALLGKLGPRQKCLIYCPWIYSVSVDKSYNYMYLSYIQGMLTLLISMKRTL